MKQCPKCKSIISDDLECKICGSYLKFVDELPESEYEQEEKYPWSIYLVWYYIKLFFNQIGYYILPTISLVLQIVCTVKGVYTGKQLFWSYFLTIVSYLVLITAEKSTQFYSWKFQPEYKYARNCVISQIFAVFAIVFAVTSLNANLFMQNDRRAYATTYSFQSWSDVGEVQNYTNTIEKGDKDSGISLWVNEAILSPTKLILNISIESKIFADTGENLLLMQESYPSVVLEDKVLEDINYHFQSTNAETYQGLLVCNLNGIDFEDVATVDLSLEKIIESKNGLPESVSHEGNWKVSFVVDGTKAASSTMHVPIKVEQPLYDGCNIIFTDLYSNGMETGLYAKLDGEIEQQTTYTYCVKGTNDLGHELYFVMADSSIEEKSCYFQLIDEEIEDESELIKQSSVLELQLYKVDLTEAQALPECEHTPIGGAFEIQLK